MLKNSSSVLFLILLLLSILSFNCNSEQKTEANQQTKPEGLPMASKNAPYSDPDQGELDRAIALASNKQFKESIELLNQIVKKGPDWAEPHWYLSKTMFWHLNSTKDPMELNYIIVNNYPAKMAKELEKYLKLAPNGEHSEDARKLLVKLKKLIEESYKSN